MKKYISFISATIIRIIVGVLAGSVLLSVIYSLPVEILKDNIISSEKKLIAEGPYPNAYSWCQSELDNYTDAIMFSEAVCDTDGASTLQKAMLSNRYRVFLDWTGLYHFIDGRPIEKIDSYARYWHGYLVVLKPLLCFTDYSGIRTINLILQTSLVITVCVMMLRRGLKDFLPPYIISVCIIAPLVIAKSLQMSTCYYIFNTGCLAILLTKKNADFRKYMFLFLWLGIATAYLDFLTYPIATFGMPATFFLISTDKNDCKKSLFRVLHLLFCWGIGYVVMWASKWLLADVVTGSHVLANATNEAEIWVNEAKENYTLWYTFYRNIRSFVLNPAMVIGLIFAIMLFVKLLKKNALNHLTIKKELCTAIPFITLSLLPFVWYSAMIAHSYVHDFFTSKALVTTAFSILCMLKTLILFSSEKITS